MRKIINHRLYSEYFPIQDEQKMQEFLEKEGKNLIQALCKVKREALLTIMSKQRKYIDNMKSPVSLLGNINVKKIMNNITIEETMKRDKGLAKAEEELLSAEQISAKLELHEDMLVSEINDALEMINDYRHRFITDMTARLFACVVMISFIIWLSHLV